MPWTKKQVETLIKFYARTPIRELEGILGKSYGAIKARVSKLKLRKDPGYKMRQLALSKNELAFIKKNYYKHTYREIAEMLDRGESTVRTYMSKMGLKGKQNNGRFKKGIIPWSKGKKMPPGWGGNTRFKKGQIPKNTKSDGYISIRHNYKRKHSYVWIRIQKGYWRELHRVVWERTMGPIPPGYNVQFKDGKTTNCDPSNLYLINRHNQIKQNTIMRYPPDLRKLIHLSAKLKRKIKSYEGQD